jgi:hypothetical protein
MDHQRSWFNPTQPSNKTAAKGAASGLNDTGSLTVTGHGHDFGIGMHPGIPPGLNSGPQSANNEAGGAAKNNPGTV